MDMSDIGRPTSREVRGNQSAGAIAAQPERWHELVSQMGAEIAAPLSAALERINSLTSTGRIDRQGLRALRDEVETARQIGMIGQQLTRFASGRTRQSQERLQLADVLNAVINHRSRQTHARGITLQPSLKPVEVVVDATLLFGLLNATVDWALNNAQESIGFAIEVKTWPPCARLNCSFVHRPIDELSDGHDAIAPASLDSLTWRLLEQTAWTMGLPIERKDEKNETQLILEFPRIATNPVEGLLSATDTDDGFAPSANSQPLAGSHVLVIASRRDMRVQIRDALRHMSLIIDFVNSVDEAIAFCSEGLPHAIVIESIQSGERFAQFRDGIAAEVPEFVFIEIIEEGSTFEMSGFSGASMARVGRDVLASSLPSALLFELSKGQ
jgi:hypothetical protein